MEDRTYVIGITGGSGSGKTTLLNMIRDRGGLVLDCDEIYHSLLKTDAALLRSIEDRFPGTVEDGVLQRKKLGAIVFSDSQALEDLNRITHGAVHEGAFPLEAVVDQNFRYEFKMGCSGEYFHLEHDVFAVFETFVESCSAKEFPSECLPPDKWHRAAVSE